MFISEREISPNKPPYIIAEASCNHGGSLENALDLIKKAKESGADAVKFQAYTADTITIDHYGPDFILKDGPWQRRNLHELYKKTQTPFEWFPYLFGRARALEITAFASVFDKSSIDMLERLECPAYKIASMEITDTPLIRYAASTKKPILLSTGMANYQEIADASFAAVMGGTECAVLHCVSGYPTLIQNANLKQLGQHSTLYGVSDHSLGSVVPMAATALGAHIIEKHLMLGNVITEDYEFSASPADFAHMVDQVRAVWAAIQVSTSEAEESSRQLRRSLYVVKDMAAGERFTEDNVRSIRPAYGMEPGKLPWVLMKIASQNLSRGTALKIEHIAEAP